MVSTVQSSVMKREFLHDFMCAGGRKVSWSDCFLFIMNLSVDWLRCGTALSMGLGFVNEIV